MTTKTTTLYLSSCVALPIIAGASIYLLNAFHSFPILVKNYLPDGLWAFALMSCLLVIWNNKLNGFWLTLCILFFAAFEALQYLHIINGVADYYDFITYLLFATMALLLNKILFKSIIYETNV